MDSPVKVSRHSAANPHKVTIEVVAKRAVVSKGLVSFALNNRPGVAPETRVRILQAAKELGWKPSLRARSLSTQRSYALGLVIARDPDVLASDPFFPSFIAGVESILAPEGRALVFSVVPDAEPELKTFRSLVADGRVDGVFLSDLRHHDERIPLLVELGLPAVTLGRPDEPSPFPAVTVDDTPGVIASVAHLATLATPASRTSRAAVRCCMAAAGARPSPPPSARPGCRRDRPSRPISPWLPDRTPPAPPDPGDSPDRDRLRQRPDGHGRPQHGARAGGAGSRRALDHGLRRHRLLSLPLPAADERQLRTCLRAPSTCPM